MYILTQPTRPGAPVNFVHALVLVEVENHEIAKLLLNAFGIKTLSQV